MDFIKKHYEKVVLSIVLVGLAVASAFMFLRVSSVQQFLQEQKDKIKAMPSKPLKQVNLSSNEVVLKRLTAKEDVKLAKDHNLFNPVTWVRGSDGVLRKRASMPGGPSALSATKINPLNLVVVYEGTNSSGDTLRYQFGVTREADKSAAKRRKVPYFGSIGGQNEVFVLREIRGAKDNPDEFVLEMKDDKRLVVVKRDKPYTQVMGYTADLRYDLENKNFLGKRIDEKISFAGDTYNIVAIDEREVVLSSTSTTKRFTIKYNAAP